MKKNKFFNQQVLSYLFEILNSIFLPLNNEDIQELRRKIIFLEEKLKVYEKEIQDLKISQEKVLKKLETIFIVICINLLIITFLIFILLLKFLLK